MKYQINLIKKKKQTVFDKAIYFSLNYLRYILVITQIVVIFVFFYKFKVDQDIIDLKEAVAQKKEIIEISEPLLKLAETTEKKIDLIKPILLTQKKQQSFFQYFLSVFPENLYLSEMSLRQDVVEIEGYAYDPTIIRIFYYRLIKDDKFKQVNLKSIKKGDLGFEFVMELINYNS